MCECIFIRNGTVVAVSGCFSETLIKFQSCVIPSKFNFCPQNLVEIIQIFCFSLKKKKEVIFIFSGKNGEKSGIPGKSRENVSNQLEAV
jgi:hypothetical protein